MPNHFIAPDGLSPTTDPSGNLCRKELYQARPSIGVGDSLLGPSTILLYCTTQLQHYGSAVTLNMAAKRTSKVTWLDVY